MADISLIENKLGLLIWKTSNFWQAKLRRILASFKISLNEYLILESINYLSKIRSNTYQNEIANLISIDVSVTSVTLKLLEKKKYITRVILDDNRKKIISITKKGKDMFNLILPLIQEEESYIFSKLNNETFNFTNSLKLLLGKKIRIKASKE
jgi:DNA-binding MarR family transcriptional regulator